MCQTRLCFKQTSVMTMSASNARVTQCLYFVPISSHIVNIPFMLYAHTMWFTDLSLQVM